MDTAFGNHLIPTTKKERLYIHESCKNALITSLIWTKGHHLALGGQSYLNENRFSWLINTPNTKVNLIRVTPDGEETAVKEWEKRINLINDTQTHKIRYELFDYVGYYYKKKGKDQNWINENKPDITDIFENHYKNRSRIKSKTPETPQNQKGQGKEDDRKPIRIIQKSREVTGNELEVKPLEFYKDEWAVNPNNPNDKILITAQELWESQPQIQNQMLASELELMEYYGRLDYWNDERVWEIETIKPKEDKEQTTFTELIEEVGLNVSLETKAPEQTKTQPDRPLPEPRKPIFNIQSVIPKTYKTKTHTIKIGVIKKQGFLQQLTGLDPNGLKNREELGLQMLGKYLEETRIIDNIDGSIDMGIKQGTKANNKRIGEFALQRLHHLHQNQIEVKQNH